MIILLRSGPDAGDGVVDPDLARVGDVEVVRAPRRPRHRRAERTPAGILWADRRLAALSRRITDGEVSAVVCGDDHSAAFAWRVAERFPDLPVLNGQATAARILGLLADRGDPWTADAVRRLLDAERRPWPTLPAYLVDAAARPPLIVSLIPGSVGSHPRAARMAMSAADAGYDSVMVGAAPPDEPDGDYLILDRVVALQAAPVADVADVADEPAAEPGRSAPAPWNRLRGYSRRLRRQREAAEPGDVAPGAGDTDDRLRILLQLRPDVVHVHDPSLLPLARSARRLLRRSGHRVALVGDVTPGEGWADGLDAVTTTSEPEVGAAGRQVLALPDAASIGGTPTSDVRADCGLPGDTTLIVLRDAAEDHVDLALRTLEHLPQAHLAVVPDHPVAPRHLIRLARRRGVDERFHVLTAVPLDQVVSYISTADVGLVPDASQDPVAVHEFAAAGVPVAVVGASQEVAALITNQGLGAVVTQARPQRIARVSANLADHAAAASPPTGDGHVWDSQAHDLVALYTQLVGPPSATPPSAARVLIGAANSAGQGAAWATALSGGGVPARSLELRSPENPFGYPADVVLPRQSVKDLQRRVQVMLREVLPHPVIILESAQALAAPEPGGVTGRRAGFREAEALASAGHSVGLMFHGSDVRRPDIHARTHPWSPFRLREFADLTREQTTRVRKTHELLAAWSGPVMVSTPDLVQQHPGAVWVPVVIDVERFRPATPDTDPDPDAGPPVVLHLPSKSVFKGSHFIDPVLQQLAAEGVIRYRRATGVPHDRVPELMRGADIFVDQLGMGILGVAALEAMASGLPVVTDPGPEALTAYGTDVPLVPVDPDTIEAAIRALAADPERRHTLAHAGPGFVREHHDGRRSAQAIIGAMGLAVPSRP